MTTRARPWRAAAYWPLGPYGRAYAGHASARTRAGLDGFVERYEGQGCKVELWEVLPHPAVDEACRAT